jgi:hypothetical protein
VADLGDVADLDSELRRALEGGPVLDNGQPVPPIIISTVLSRGIVYKQAQLPHGNRYRKPGTCYGTSARYVLAHPGHTYVEGFGYCWRNDLERFEPLRHAWVVAEDSTDVIDLTWRRSGGPVAYLGVPFSFHETQKLSEAGWASRLEWLSAHVAVT